MTNVKRLIILSTVAAVALVCADASAKGNKTDVNLPADQVKLTPVEGVSGVSQADLWGDSSKGAHGTLVKFAAGTKTALHTHSRDDKIVVISGTMVFGNAEGKEVKLGPGSYRLEPAHFPHTTSCAEGADCLMFHTQSGAFDIKMVEAAKK